jgi:SAM-dependent methyltransferase
MEPLDWADGDYARTAAELAPVAAAMVDFAGVREEDRVLDVACGTGNAALVAAARGAQVTGVDPAVGLLEQAETRAREQGVPAIWIAGAAEDLPVPGDAFDVALSVFGVIFSPEPVRAASEMTRAVRSGGTVALTGWKPAGPISAAGGLIVDALGLGGGEPRAWGDRDWVASVLAGAGAVDVRFGDATLAFSAESPEAWWRDQEAFDPFWRWGRRQMPAERWEALHADTIALLSEANEDPTAFRTTSGYLLAAAQVR